MYKKNKKGLYFNEAYLDGSSFYFTSVFHSGFFRFDTGTGVTTYLGGEEYSPRKHYRRGFVSRIDDSLYAVPYFSEGILEYNLKEKKVVEHHIELTVRPNAENTNCAFRRIIKYKGIIYLIPASYPAIVAFDPISDEVREINNWVDDFVLDEKLFFYSKIDEGGTVFLLLDNTDRVLKYDLNKEEYKIYELGKGNNLEFIESDKENLYFTNVNPRQILRMNKENRRVDVLVDFSLEDEEFLGSDALQKSGMHLMNDLRCVGSRLLLCSSHRSCLLEFNVKKLHKRLIKLPEISGETAMDWQGPFSILSVYDKIIYCLRANNSEYGKRRIQSFDNKWNLIEDYEMEYPFNYKAMESEYLRKAIDGNIVIYEDEEYTRDITFSEMIQVIMESNRKKENIDVPLKRSIGKQIYKRVVF